MWSVRRFFAPRSAAGGAMAAMALWAMAVQAAPLSVRIVPHDFVVPVGGSQALTLDARDAENAPVSGTVTWSVRPPSAGRVGPDGVFVAGTAPAEAVVRAEFTRSGRTTTAWAHVRVGTPRGARVARTLVVTPRQARIAPNATQAFVAQTLDGAAAGEVHWRVIPPSAGRIDNAGVFVAGPVAAQCQVVAVARDASGRPGGLGAARVAIDAAGAGRGDGDEVAGLEAGPRLLPARAVVSPGETKTFTTTLPATAAAHATIVWSVQPPTLGTIAQDGTFTAGVDAKGAGVVVATVTGVNGRSKRIAAAVQVAPEAAARNVTLTPRSAAVPAGQTVQFQIAGLPAAAQSRATVEWRVRPETGGTISGTGGVAVFTAGRSRGQVRIQARVTGPNGGQRVLESVVTITDPSRQADVAPQFSIEAPATMNIRQPGMVRLSVPSANPGAFNDATIDWSVSPASFATITATAGRRGTAKLLPLLPGRVVVTATVSFEGMTRTASKEIVISP